MLLTLRNYFQINNIRKAVDISPSKNKGISLLKKSNQPLILKKMNVITSLANVSMQGMQATTSESMTLIPVKSLPTTILPKSAVTTTTTHFVPIVPKPPKIISLEANKVAFSLSKSSVINPSNTAKTVTAVPSLPSTSNLNYKILKVVRTPALVKPNDSPTPSDTMKLKTAESYSVMLKDQHLAHFYKCMGRNCRYTTDSLILYYYHYHQHCQEIVKYSQDPDKQKRKHSYDYQRCAYCSLQLNDWNSIRHHVWEKHGHCRYQCGYCFYRAVVPSYVQQHQVSFIAIATI